ncbi:MAG: ABC transporter ATP-binding protein [Dehalococcoidia bacterium]|nr:MAG: ABC transporter ATP-binding protein [Dehalococcoidia bacterium]
MIQIKNLCVDLGDFLLRDINLNVEAGEYFVILGPTAAGKTVLLESLAGLYPLKSGEIWLRGNEVTRLSPERRGISIVYQDHVLFPHLSVAGNITFGLKLHRHPDQELTEVLNWLSHLLGIAHLLDRRPDTLSGGERQKVALARALSVKPEVLLLDEPLSALDPETREGVQRELRQLHNQLKITTIHVTHDFEEAVALGDRIAVLGDGCIHQTGTPDEIFRRPNSEFVARFAMTKNIFTGEVVVKDGRNAVFHTEDVELVVVTDLRGKWHASIRPEDILISYEPLHSSARNSFCGTITNISNKGAILYLTVTLPPDFICLVTRHSFEEMGLSEGKKVYITFKASAIHVF